MHQIGFRTLCLSLIFLLSYLTGKGQILFNNPSFELNISGINIKAYSWDTCGIGFILPETTSGLYEPKAINGSKYSYLFCSYEYWNNINLSTNLNCPLIKYKIHSFKVYLATWFSFQKGDSEVYGAMQIYGGFAPCSYDELLWQSPVTDTFWRQYEAVFTPSKNYTYLTFAPKQSISGSYVTNMLMDGLSPIYIENLSEITASASTTEVKAGEGVQLQSIVNSNLIQPPYSITWHSSLTDFTSTAQNPGEVYPVITTTYYVELKDSCGYKAWDSVVVHVNSGGKVYYDFANQKIKVVFGSEDAGDNYQLTLYNAIGQRMATSAIPLDVNKFEYSTSHLPNAMYFVSVRSKDGKVFGGKVEVVR